MRLGVAHWYLVSAVLTIVMIGGSASSEDGTKAESSSSLWSASFVGLLETIAIEATVGEHGEVVWGIPPTSESLNKS